LKSNSPIKITMRPSHPGAFLRDEVIEELGLSTTKAAEILGVRRATLSNLVNERASLSPEMALRVEKAFGVSMELMLRMQALFDAHAMRMRAGTIEVERFVAERAA
jgi:antitoxin HigA-1